MKSRIDNYFDTAYRNVRNDIVNTYNRWRGPAYEELRNISRKVDRWESCNWQCVQGCYNANLTIDDNNDECFRNCGCYDDFIRYVAKKIEAKASNISRRAGSVARSNDPTPFVFAAVSESL